VKARIALMALAAMILASCATYSLVAANSRTPIGNGLSVQPTLAWNRNERLQEPNVVLWTMDGPLVDALGFVPGLENNASILKTPSGKEPMPVFRSGMGAVEVMELFEATLARSSATSSVIVKTAHLRPAQFAGRPGFRFDYTFVNQSDDVERRGIAAGAVHGGRLYLIFFQGPKIHYFGKDAPEVEAIIASAQIS
jgi:hypothetical protein